MANGAWMGSIGSVGMYDVVIGTGARADCAVVVLAACDGAGETRAQARLPLTRNETATRRKPCWAVENMGRTPNWLERPACEKTALFAEKVKSGRLCR
jgi:hypothetical protein